MDPIVGTDLDTVKDATDGLEAESKDDVPKDFKQRLSIYSPLLVYMGSSEPHRESISNTHNYS